MKKCTKLGISVGLLSAICFFLGYVNLAMGIIAFVVILAATDTVEVKKNAGQAVIFYAFFWFLESICSVLAGGITKLGTQLMYSGKASWICNFGDFMTRYNLFTGLNGILKFIAFVFMIVFIILSLKGKEIKIPLAKKMVDKAFASDAE